MPVFHYPYEHDSEQVKYRCNDSNGMHIIWLRNEAEENWAIYLSFFFLCLYSIIHTELNNENNFILRKPEIFSLKNFSI